MFSQALATPPPRILLLLELASWIEQLIYIYIIYVQKRDATCLCCKPQILRSFFEDRPNNGSSESGPTGPAMTGPTALLF